MFGITDRSQKSNALYQLSFLLSRICLLDFFFVPLLHLFDYLAFVSEVTQQLWKKHYFEQRCWQNWRRPKTYFHEMNIVFDILTHREWEDLILILIFDILTHGEGEDLTLILILMLILISNRYWYRYLIFDILTHGKWEDNGWVLLGSNATQGLEIPAALWTLFFSLNNGDGDRTWG